MGHPVVNHTGHLVCVPSPYMFSCFLFLGSCFSPSTLFTNKSFFSVIIIRSVLFVNPLCFCVCCFVYSHVTSPDKKEFLFFTLNETS